MRALVTLALVLVGNLPAAAVELPDPTPPPPMVAPTPDAAWFIQPRALVSLSHAPGDFTTLPPLATGSDQTSYQPQEYFGVGVGVGRELDLFGLQGRALFDTSFNFRHDTDMEAGGNDYEANLQTLDLRVSLLADVLDFGWGRFYVGAGLGAARVRTEVEIAGTPETTTNVEWKVSPSVEAGLAFTSLSRRVIPTIGYRFRWIGDVESDAFPDGTALTYEDFHVHDVMFGFKIPLTAFTPAATSLAAPEPAGFDEEAPWTGFHAGIFGGYAISDDVTATSTVPASPSFGFDTDGGLAGVSLGVDWQWRWVVLGLQGEAAWLGLDGNGSDPAAAGTETSLTTDWYGGVSARGGLAWRNLLAYGRVGVAYLSAEAETSDGAALDISEDDLLFGFSAGGGLEYAFARNWSANVEYRYIAPWDSLQPAGGGTAQDVEIDRIHTARAGLNFRW